MLFSMLSKALERSKFGKLKYQTYVHVYFYIVTSAINDVVKIASRNRNPLVLSSPRFKLSQILDYYDFIYTSTYRTEKNGDMSREYGLFFPVITFPFLYLSLHFSHLSI